jgi:glycine/D-amino acid oxidase-like deaminating enzyme
MQPASRQTDVLVVGGGLAGCALACYLARDGVEVVVVEQHDLNTQASGCNAGGIHGQIPHEMWREEGEAWARYFAPALPLMLASAELWAGLSEDLGADVEFARTGGLLVAETDGQMREIAAKAVVDRAFGVDIEVLGRDDLREMAPYLSHSLVGAVWCPNEGRANPLLATPAYARAAERHGALILRHTRLEALERQRGGFAASTSAGPVRAARVINCAGASSSAVAAMVGLSLPIEGHAIQVNVTEPVAPLVPHLVYSGGERLTLKQTPRGAFLIGGGWPARLDRASGRPVVDEVSVRRNLHYAVAAVPQLRHVQLLRTWPAIVNGTTDWRPVLGEVDGVPGFFMCMFPWMGVTGGPVAARIVADLVLGRDPGFDLDGFSTSRFAA